MNPWQMAQQIKHELERVTWPTGSQEVVFGTRGVKVFAGRPNEDQIPAAFPWAMVGIDGGTPDTSHPELISQSYTIMSAAMVAGEAQGEHGIIGGPAADLGRSAGRGVGEISERVRAAVQHLTGSDGASVLLALTNTGSPSPLGRGRHVVLDEHRVTALCTSELYYTAPQQLNLNGIVWTWEGSHCSSRFDFVQFRLVEKAGDEPSTDPTDGTVIYTGTATTYNGPFSGTVTVFADYSSRGGGRIEGSSSPEVGAYL